MEKTQVLKLTKLLYVGIFMARKQNFYFRIVYIIILIIRSTLRIVCLYLTNLEYILKHAVFFVAYIRTHSNHICTHTHTHTRAQEREYEFCSKQLTL